MKHASAGPVLFRGRAFLAQSSVTQQSVRETAHGSPRFG